MADLGCGAKCAKYVLFVINLLFSLIGFILLGVGIFLIVDVKALHDEHLKGVGFSDDLIVASAVVITIVGVVILFVAMVGCVGASRENSSCLTCYSVLVALLIILQIIAIIMAAAYHTQIISQLTNTMMQSLQHDYGRVEDTTSTFNYLQFGFHCCGVNGSGPINYEDSYWHQQTPNQTVPLSCCTVKDGSDSSPNKVIPKNESLCMDFAYNTSIHDDIRSEYVYIEGCEAKVEQGIKRYIGVLIGVVVAFVIIQVVFVIVACLLKSSVASRYEYV